MKTAADPEPTLPTSEVRPGQVLGRYELLLPIAAGGMAMVWAARLKGTRGFQKIVAVKTMLPKLSEDPQFEQMFLDEAALACQIRHPHIVEILDLGEDQGVLFLVMEWIDGVPLNQIMKAAKRKNGLPLSIAIRIVMQACAGLHAAHELKNNQGELLGLVHRDVSPQNILVTYAGVTKVVDFGVAKATAAGEGSTVAGQIKGKVSYMAPEQVRGEPLDRRADVFAMGIILFALTTGKHPFRKDSEAATMYNICAPQPVLPPRKIVSDYPPQLEAVVLKALAKDRERRYATTNDMLRALDHVLPAASRANSDEDVAKFVRELFSDREEEQRRALKEALRVADETGAAALSGLLSADRQGLTPVSSISMAGHRQVETTGITGTSPLIAATTHPEVGPKKHRNAVIGAAALAVVAVAGAVMALSGQGDQPRSAPEKATPPPPAADSSVLKPPEPVKPETPAPPAASSGRLDINDLQPEGNDTPPEVEADPTKVRPRPPIGVPVKPPPRPKWREDPGF